MTTKRQNNTIRNKKQLIQMYNLLTQGEGEEYNEVIKQVSSLAVAAAVAAVASDKQEHVVIRQTAAAAETDALEGFVLVEKPPDYEEERDEERDEEREDEREDEREEEEGLFLDADDFVMVQVDMLQPGSEYIIADIGYVRDPQEFMVLPPREFVLPPPHPHEYILADEGYSFLGELYRTP